MTPASGADYLRLPYHSTLLGCRTASQQVRHNRSLVARHCPPTGIALVTLAIKFTYSLRAGEWIRPHAFRDEPSIV